MVWVLTAVNCAYAIWFKPINAWLLQTIAGRIALAFLIAGAVFLVGMLVFVATSGYGNVPTGQEKVVVVLGAGLRRDKPQFATALTVWTKHLNMRRPTRMQS